jgi:ATPase subunit of ABC transporter with duplicated ATPase domains
MPVAPITEIEDGRLTTFTGDYTNYMIDKAERLARQQVLFRAQQKKSVADRYQTPRPVGQDL